MDGKRARDPSRRSLYAPPDFCRGLACMICLFFYHPWYHQPADCVNGGQHKLRMGEAGWLMLDDEACESVISSSSRRKCWGASAFLNRKRDSASVLVRVVIVPRGGSAVNPRPGCPRCADSQVCRRLPMSCFPDSNKAGAIFVNAPALSIRFCPISQREGRGSRAVPLCT